MRTVLFFYRAWRKEREMRKQLSRELDQETERCEKLYDLWQREKSRNVERER